MSPKEIDFGNVYIGNVKTATLTIKNSQCTQTKTNIANKSLPKYIFQAFPFRFTFSALWYVLPSILKLPMEYYRKHRQLRLGLLPWTLPSLRGNWIMGQVTSLALIGFRKSKRYHEAVKISAGLPSTFVKLDISGTGSHNEKFYQSYLAGPCAHWNLFRILQNKCCCRVSDLSSWHSVASCLFKKKKNS